MTWEGPGFVDHHTHLLREAAGQPAPYGERTFESVEAWHRLVLDRWSTPMDEPERPIEVHDGLRGELERTLDRAAAVVVDDVATARAQAGPLVDVPDLDLVPLGDVVTGAAAPRRSPDDVIFYNSVGLGVQDAAAAARIVALAAEAGVGRRVAL